MRPSHIIKNMGKCYTKALQNVFVCCAWVLCWQQYYDAQLMSQQTLPNCAASSHPTQPSAYTSGT